MTRWLSCGLLVLLLAGLAPGGGPSVEAATRPASLAAATRWLRDQQHGDGGFGVPSSSGTTTTDVVLALAAADVDLATVRSGGPLVMEYLSTIAPDYGKTPVGAAKLTLAASAAGMDPRSFGGVDLVAGLKGVQNAEGQYGQSLFEHGYVVLALAGAGEPIDPRAAERIVSSQIADGSWGFAGPGQPGEGDTNTTALLIQALIASGRPESPALPRALAYLKQALAPGGGFVYGPGLETPPIADANSTGLVIQALLALNEEPDAPVWEASLARLASFQNTSGALRWRDDQPDDNLLATVQALPALALLYFPFGPGDATGTRARRTAARPLAPVPSSADRLYVPETGHTLAHGFRHAWEHMGGWEVFGLPLTEEFQEVNPADGRTYTVQYFERARFEYHPEHAGTPYEVEFGHLGRPLVIGRTEAAFERVDRAPAAECAYVAATGHAVCGAFRAAWEERGGVTIFGLPLSEVFEEGDVQVQYFERARFEYRAGVMGWGLLGRELLYGAR
jgi:hypothetical protein